MTPLDQATSSFQKANINPLMFYAGKSRVFKEYRVDTFASQQFIKITRANERARKANNINLHKAIEGRDPNANDTQKIKLVLLTGGL